MEGLIGPLWGRIFGVHAAALDGGITFTMLQTEDDDDDDDVSNGRHKSTEHKYSIIFYIGPTLLEIFDVEYLTKYMLLIEPKRENQKP